MLSTFSHFHPALRTSAIWHPGPNAPRDGYVVALFRRTIALKRAIPATTIWVSASQRFEFFLDGELLARGPSRSDPLRWGCVRIRLPALASGSHVLAARVVHFGQHGGLGQMGGPAFLMVAPDSDTQPVADLVRTNGDWRCTVDESTQHGSYGEWGAARRHSVVGSGDHVDGRLRPWGWERASFNDSSWPGAHVVCSAAYDGWGNIPLNHLLRPDPLPHMTEAPQQPLRVAEASPEIKSAAERWLRNGGALTIGPRKELNIVLDMGAVLNAYPTLTVSGGANAHIVVVSAEACYDPETNLKGNRDETAGKKFWGNRDDFIADGGRDRTYSTLWLRSFRYLSLTIRTSAKSLTINNLTATATAFPMKAKSRFSVDAAHKDAWKKTWDVTWRTAVCCSHETFFDCPHYEQMQFPGDSRVQAIFHYLAASEDRLARKAIDDFHASRISEGLTLCKYPSRKQQLIATYALYWIGMLRDFLLYRGDADFLRGYIPAAREIMDWYDRRLRQDGMLGHIPYAPFMDWTEGFKFGNAPQDEDGGSSILTLLFAHASDWMAELETHAGFPELAPRWRRHARSLVSATLRKCWDKRRGLLADTPSKKSFSQHAQIHAILADAWQPAKSRSVLRRALAETDVIKPGTFYFRFYLVQAAKRCGMRNFWFDILPMWESRLEGTGLTTWPETDGQRTRSDCHAWSVSPGIEFFETVLGVEPDPASPGFGAIRFTPTLGPLNEASGSVVTPRGTVFVELHRQSNGRIGALLQTPVPAYLGQTGRRLMPGRHVLNIADGK